MPLKQQIIGKRKAPAMPAQPSKRVAIVKEGVPPYTEEGAPEAFGIVQREFYPPEMSNARALQYKDGILPQPLQQLHATLQATAAFRDYVPVGKAVIHWFKMDLRLQDNKALHLASEKAKSAGVPLICVYLISPQDYQAHVRAPIRIDFMLRTLQVIKDDLAMLDIPLYVETVLKRKQLPSRLMELASSWGANHIYANIEYEVDELRRETALVNACLERGIAFTACEDTCVVAPGELASQQGQQYAVYSPWFRAWLAYCHQHPEQLDLFDPPGNNPFDARITFKDIFEQTIPEAPENKRLTEEQKKRFRALWPPGEHEAQERLSKFLDEKVGRYKDTRNFPSQNSTAVLSVHLAAGTISSRTAVRRARDVNNTKKLDAGNPGIANWISEVAWREFYKHVLARWPYVWYV